MVIDGGSEHLHLHGGTANRTTWSTEWSSDGDGFDADALERAMLDARRSAYSELADLNAA